MAKVNNKASSNKSEFETLQKRVKWYRVYLTISLILIILPGIYVFSGLILAVPELAIFMLAAICVDLPVAFFLTCAWKRAKKFCLEHYGTEDFATQLEILSCGVEG